MARSDVVNNYRDITNASVASASQFGSAALLLGGLLLLQILATTGHGPDIVYAELDFAEIEERRTNMPLTQQKRLDLYELIDKSK